jgi:hypothetical protein
LTESGFFDKETTGFEQRQNALTKDKDFEQSNGFDQRRRL